jgi:transcriptional regulator with XRE-family HTH domain
MVMGMENHNSEHPHATRLRQAAVRIDGNRVRRLRQVAGKTQGQLAEAAGISTVYVSFIESGRRSTIGPAVFVRLCDALGVDDRETLMLPEAA